MAPRARPQAPSAYCSGKSADERWAAVHSLRMAGVQRLGYRQVAAAKNFYQAMAPTSIIGKWKEFATRWFSRVRKGKGVEDEKRDGRPGFVTRDEALVIATQWTQGTVGRGGDKRGYSSMEEVSCT